MEITSRTQIVELMKELGLPLTAAEIGVAEGNFSLELVQLGIEKLYMVDLWENVPFIDGCASFEQSWHDKNYEQIIEKFKLNNKVRILKGFSYKMAEHIPNETLGLVYIDGDHSYTGVKADINSYLPKLIKDGIMCFHDYGNAGYGVNKAVNEFTKNEGLFILPEDGDINNLGAFFIKK